MISTMPIAKLPRTGEEWMDPWHRRLAHRNRVRLGPRVPNTDWQSELAEQIRTQEMEDSLLQVDRAAVRTRVIGVPTHADDVLSWFHDLRIHGAGQGDALFPWLAETATYEGMCWFLTQEAAGEAGFDDLVALAQIRIPARADMEMARNYWDEMGRGTPDAVHAELLDATVRELDLQSLIDDTVWESLALANVMLALATNRAFAYHAIGALGVIEMTAPARVGLINEGLMRLGVPANARRYFQVHAPSTSSTRKHGPARSFTPSWRNHPRRHSQSLKAHYCASIAGRALSSATGVNSAWATPFHRQALLGPQPRRNCSSRSTEAAPRGRSHESTAVPRQTRHPL